MAYQGQLVVTNGDDVQVRTNQFAFATKEEAEYLIERFQKASDLQAGTVDEDGGVISYRVVETDAEVNETLDLEEERALDALEAEMDGIQVLDIGALADGQYDIGGEG